mgnify:CR=1 FL=1
MQRLPRSKRYVTTRGLKMDAATIASLILGTIGTLTGCYASWLSFKATSQEITIIRTHPTQLSFAIVNYSIRPIPVQSITLDLDADGNTVRCNTRPKLSGLDLPGVLAPESRCDIEWDGQEQLIDLVWYESFTLIIETQTGRTFRLKGTAKKTPTRGS